MRTRKPNSGTLVVFFLSLLFAAASFGMSAKPDARGPALASLVERLGVKAEARPLSENKWIENEAVGGGSDAPDPALPGSSSYPVSGGLPQARGKAPVQALAHGIHRQAPPATGPPTA